MKNQRHVSIRMDAEMLDKFYYASKYYGRSGSGQITYLMRSFVAEFERKHGKIRPEEIIKESVKEGGTPDKP